MSGYESTDRRTVGARATQAVEPDGLRARPRPRPALRVARRLAAKTQVVAPGTDDFVRNRLTHSLEVAQVGREPRQGSRLRPLDVVDTACLAHDLGHPPFGHNGEAALDEIAEPIGGFEECPNLRVLTRLEAKAAHPDGRTAGLNLTRASLDASTKYPWPRGSHGTGKFGVYADDAEVFGWLRQGAPAGRRRLEAQVMDFADDVAYSVHDVEDAIVAQRIGEDTVLSDRGVRDKVALLTCDWYSARRFTGRGARCAGPPACSAVLGECVRRTAQHAGRPQGHDQPAHRPLLRGRAGGHPCGARRGRLTRYAADLEIPSGTRAEVAVLGGLAAVYVMNAEDRAPIYVHQRELLHELVALLRDRAPAGLGAVVPRRLVRCS